MNDFYLSFLMGAEKIEDEQLLDLGIEIIEKEPDGDRKLKIPSASLIGYLDLIRFGLDLGFWNEVVGSQETIFIFRFKDGVTKKYILSLENEEEVSQLCSQFNGDPIEKTANVYKYISANDFYKEFMDKYYADLISR